MVDHNHMQATVQQYIAGFAEGDASAVVVLFADDATVEDPVGSPARHGRDAIEEFYGHAVGTGAKLRLDGPVRTAGDTAAFAFSIAIPGDQPQRLHVIDTFRFDESGKVKEMRAIWGPDNIEPDES
jgi:steroid delta-isomerase